MVFAAHFIEIRNVEQDEEDTSYLNAKRGDAGRFAATIRTRIASMPCMAHEGQVFPAQIRMPKPLWDRK